MAKKHGFTISEVKEDIAQLQGDLLALNKFIQDREKDRDILFNETVDLKEEFILLKAEKEKIEIETKNKKAKLEQEIETHQTNINNKLDSIAAQQRDNETQRLVLKDKEVSLDKDKAELARKKEFLANEIIQSLKAVEEFKTLETKRAQESAAVNRQALELVEQNKELTKLASNLDKREETLELNKKTLKSGVLALEEGQQALTQNKNQYKIDFEAENEVIILDLAGIEESKKLLKEKEVVIANKELNLTNRDKQIEDKETSQKAEDRELKIREGLLKERQRVEVLEGKGVKLDGNN